MNYSKVIFWLFIGFTGCCSACSLNGTDDIKRQDQEVLISDLQKGSWRITKFEDSGKNETHHFNGFRFSFNDNGVINAETTNLSYEGIWSISSSSGSDDSSDDLDFNIYFNLTNKLEELNDDWDIRSRSETKIELIDISGGNGGTDYLTFERN